MGKIIVEESDLHHHLLSRMRQRGITRGEIERALNEGWEADDAKAGTRGKVLIFPYADFWEGVYFEEKEVTVYHKHKDDRLILLTAKARYGSHFERGGRE